ncbi:MAG TPA: rhomboid-like protein [Mycobacterium sp.]|nr:rhomboid-like protein [Mycobacterium sp.]
MSTKLLASAPLTLGWLVVLLVTTRNQRKLSPRGRGRVLRRASTNLRHLRRDPHRVLLTSMLWFDGAAARPYLPLFIVLLAPAERRLGSARTPGLAVGSSGIAGSVARHRRPLITT